MNWVVQWWLSCSLWWPVFRHQLRSKDFKNIESWIFWTVTRHLCNPNLFRKVHPPALSAEALALSSKWPRRVGIVVRGTSQDFDIEAWSGLVHHMLFYWTSFKLFPVHIFQLIKLRTMDLSSMAAGFTALKTWFFTCTASLYSAMTWCWCLGSLAVISAVFLQIQP